MRKIKICFIADIQNIHTQRWVKYFAQKGHEIHVVSAITDSQSDYSHLKSVIIHPLNRVSKKGQGNKRSGNSLPEKDSFLRIVWHKFYAILPKSLGPFLTFYVLYLWRAKKLIKVIKPDIVHGHFLTDYGFLAAMTGFHPLVISAWGSDVLVVPTKSVIDRMKIRYVIKRSNIVNASAGHLLEQLRLNYGLNGKKISKDIINGVDLATFESVRYPRSNERNKIKVISFRNLEPIYDIETFIRTIPYVIEKAKNIFFIIGGDGSERVKLQSKVKDLGIEKYVEFVRKIPHDDIPFYLSQQDIYVSTSLSDGYSISLLEAMAAGCFPIVTDIPANRDWIKDGVNGFLIPPQSPITLAEKIMTAIQNHQLRETAKVLNKQIVRERASWETLMEKLENLYIQLINGESP